MTFFYAIITGALYAAGFYMVMRRSLVKIIIGLIFLGHAANLLIFTVGRATEGAAAFIPAGAGSVNGDISEPLPQALILTAIVIGFGVQAFAIVLFRRYYTAVGSDDLDEVNLTDRIDE